MKRSIACLVFIVAILLPFTAAPAADPLPRLRVEGTRILDAAGKPVILRGVNLGNWLLIEPLGVRAAMGEFPDQHTFFTILRDRFGEAERRRLVDSYRDHFIVARDFDNMQKFGFNLLRVGFDYELLEDDDRPMQLRADAFKYLDFTVQEAKARGMYVLFDLHGAQERQGDGRPAGRVGHNRFFKDPKAQERSLWMWDRIIERYKGDPTVMGYEPLNEPWGGTREQLRDYCQRWYKHLRAIDTDAIAVMPGWSDGIDFLGKPSDHGWTNTMFDMHFYPGSFERPTTTRPVTPRANVRFLQRSMPQWIERMKRLDAPLLIGEMNVVFKDAGGGEMIRRYYDIAAEQGWAITFWTIKEFSVGGGTQPRMWMLTTNAAALPPLDLQASPKEEIEARIRGLSTMPLSFDEDVLHWLTTADKPAPLPATTQRTTEPAPTGAQPQTPTAP